MFDLRDKIIETIYNILNKIGVDPIIFSAIIGIVISISYLKDIKNWNQIPSYNKSIVISTITGTLILILISLLKVINMWEK